MEIGWGYRPPGADAEAEIYPVLGTVIDYSLALKCKVLCICNATVIALCHPHIYTTS